jgi:predicted XRE-type DNA-binding protein
MSNAPQVRASQDVPGARREATVRPMARHAGVARPVIPDASNDGSAKVTLASKLNELLDANGLSQSAAAQLLGMPQPKVSAIRNYKLRGISLERLMQALLSMNQQVEIVVKPGRKAGSRSIRVAI